MIKKLWVLFYFFLKAGTFTFAGGLAMLPVIEKDVCDKYKLMGRDEFMEYASLSQTLPGVIALNCACLTGGSTAGFLGMLAAGFGAILPAFALMIVATIAIEAVSETGPVAGAFRGIRAASAALILSAAWSLGKHNLKSKFAVIIMLVSFAVVFFLDVSALFVVPLACLAGIIYMHIKRRRAKNG